MLLTFAATLCAEVKVAAEGEQWVMNGPSRRVAISARDFAVHIEAGSARWDLLPAQTDLSVRAAGATFDLPFTSAAKREFSRYQDGVETGVQIALSGFARDGKPIDLELRLLICIEPATSDLIWRFVATEHEAKLREIRWPKPVEPKSVDRTVLPAMQGMLLPRDWPKRVAPYDSISYSRGLYMPWWGQQRGEACLVTILQTPCDGGYVFDHPAGGPTTIAPKFFHSLGQFSEPRSVRMCFIERGDYVDMAKRYRRHVIESGTFVSLKEKIARRPLVGRLVGAPVIHTSILYHMQPASNYFNKDDPAKNHQLVTFDARAEHLKKLSSRGVGRAYVHLDGWGRRGYDNLHPDLLPPCEEAGGWDGMKRFADTLDSLGYLFAVHDNYRDYYRDADSFSEASAVQNEDGSHPAGHEWPGGEASILCAALAPGHVAKNHRAILDHGVKLRGAYLDVFSVVPGDECYNSMHPMTRAAGLAQRGECLDLIRALEGIASSEEPTDWSIPHIDLCHHAPYALDPGPGGGPAMGIPVPLFNLVYHDAIFIPWTQSTGGWGIPNGDWGFLHGLLNGGLPYLNVEDPKHDEIDRTRVTCALARRVGLAEMTRHEMLDPAFRRQKTTFADGTKVTIDFDKRSYEIDPPLSENELAGALRRDLPETRQ